MNSAESIKILELQFQLYLKRAEHYHTRITSGVYKTRIVHKGGDGPLMNEDELMRDEMSIASWHLSNAQEVLDLINDRLANAGAGGRNT